MIPALNQQASRMLSVSSFPLLGESGFQLEDGMPLPPGCLKLEDVGRLESKEPIQATPLSVWPDGSVRALHIIAAREKSYVGGSDRVVKLVEGEAFPPPRPDYREALPGVLDLFSKLRIEVVAADSFGGVGERFRFHPKGVRRTKFEGPLRFDYDLLGWFVDELDGERYTWGRAYAIYRPDVAPRSLEVFFVHSNMQPHKAKRGTLGVEEFSIEREPGSSIRLRPGTPRAFENYPYATENRIVAMGQSFLEDAAAQVVHFIADTGTGTPVLYRPMRPGRPETVFGYGDFDGVLPPVADVANAIVDPDMLKQVAPTAASSVEGIEDPGDGAFVYTLAGHQQTNDANPLECLDPKGGPFDRAKFERVVARWDFEVYPGEPGYKHMGVQLDFPQLVGGSVEHFERMILTANDRLEDPGQRAHPSIDGKTLVEWKHPEGRDRYPTGPVETRRTGGPDEAGILAAPDQRRFRSGRGFWARGSSQCQHNVCGAERQAWIRTGVDLFRELIVEKAEMLKTVDAFTGSAPPFSGRAAGACLSSALMAADAAQVLERTLLGWQVTRDGDRFLWDAGAQLEKAFEFAGLYRANAEWVSLPPPASELVVNLGLGSGGSTWDSIFCPWMSARWIQALVAASVLAYRAKAVWTLPPISKIAAHLAATLRFLLEVARNKDGWAYKLQCLSDAENPPYVPCDDGGKRTPGKFFTNSSSVWNAAGIGGLLFWFEADVPVWLRDELVLELDRLVAGHDRDNKGRKKWILPLAAARRVLERVGRDGLRKTAERIVANAGGRHSATARAIAAGYLQAVKTEDEE